MLNIPMDRDDFMENFYEKNICVFRGAVRADYITWSDVDDFLYHTEPRQPFLKMFMDGLVPEESYAEDYQEIGMIRRRLKKESFYKLLDDGASLVLNRIDSKFLKAKNLCMAVSRFVSEQTIANGYIAFGGTGPFGEHWDTHDVFAIQLIGKKAWKIYKPTVDLPIAQQVSRDVKDTCPQEPVFDGVLEAGDVLYVPRGWWHTVLPTYGETFHLAVGVHAPLVMDYLLWACTNRLPQYLSGRKSMRSGSRFGDDVAAAVNDIQDILLDPQNYAAFQNRVKAKERVIGAFSIGRILNADKHPLPGDTVVRLNSAYMPPASDRLPQVNGTFLELDGVEADVVRLLAETHSLRLCDLERSLDDVSPDAARTSVRQLARRDIVEIGMPL